MASFKILLASFTVIACFLSILQVSARNHHMRHELKSLQKSSFHYKSLVKTYFDTINAAIDSVRSEDDVKRTIPFSNDEIQLLMGSLPDVLDDESCLRSEKCATSWMADYNRILDKITERGAFLEVCLITKFSFSIHIKFHLFLLYL